MKIIKGIFPYLKPYLPKLIFIIFCGGIIAFLELLPIWIIKNIIDKLLATSSLKILIYGIALLSGIILFKVVFEFITNILIVVVERRFIYNLQEVFFSHILKLPLIKIKNYTTGDNISRITNDIERLGSTVITIANDIVKNVVMVIGAIIFLSIIHWKLFLCSCIALPFLLLTFSLSKKFQALSKKTQEELAKIVSWLSEVLNKMLLVKTLFAEQILQKKFKDINKGYIKAILREIKLMALLKGGIGIITYVMIFAVLFYGGYEIVHKRLSVGELIAFIGYVSMLIGPLISLGMNYADIQETIGIGNRYFELIDEEGEQEGKYPLSAITKGIIFNDVSFTYNEKDEYVFKNINFIIKKGEKIAIIAPSGTGKTTLVSLILLFYRPTKGFIKIDDHNINIFTLKSLREKIIYCPSLPMLFNASIKENILLGRDPINENKLIEVCQNVYAQGFIEELPLGYNTILQEEGGGLSEGQRQRIALARALLSNPEVLILDEATSSLDPETEGKIMEGLWKMLKDKTIIFVTHKPLPLNMVDKVYTLQNNGIFLKE